MKKFAIYFSFLIILSAQSSFNQSNQNNYYTLSVNDKKIPSLIEWTPIKSTKFKNKANLVTNKYLYKKYILPFERYLKLTKKPILIWQAKYHILKGNSYTYFSNSDSDPENILIPAPAHKYIGEIFHELVHIYIDWKQQTLQLNSKHTIFGKKMLIYTSFTSLFYYLKESITSNPLLYYLLTELFILMKKNNDSQREEMICDSYVAIALQNKIKNTKILKQYITYFKKETLNSRKENHIENFINDFFYFSTHPSHEKRIKHLLAIKSFLEQGKINRVKQWIKQQEKILFDDCNFFNLLYIPHL